MRRLLFALITFSFMNVVSYVYLKNMISDKRVLEFEPSETVLFYRNKDIEFYEDEDFSFDEYISVITNIKPKYTYDMSDGILTVRTAEKTVKFTYMIKEPEIIETETIVIQEVPVYINNTSSSNTSSVNTQTQVLSDTFSVNQNKYRFSAGTDLNTIISQIRNAVSSSQEITIDFSTLNPNEKGSYIVYFYSGNNKAEISVEIV